MNQSPKQNRYLRSADGTRQFTYFAFISYKHKDMRWGRWLQNQLENYRLPVHLREPKDRPQRLSPIFRDETDLTAGETVKKQLREKLSQCKYLIVICSRHMQQNPEYIDFEIEQFLSMGNPRSHILPLIVDGEAASRNPKMECLPPALLSMGEDRPLGATLDRKKKHEAILNLVAAMHGLDIQALRTHDEARRQRQKTVALCAAACTAMAVGSLLLWNYLTVKQAHLREANVNASLLLEQGDRLRAGEAAQSTLSAAHLLIDPAISEDAEKIQALAAIHPLLSPFTRLCASASDQTVRFTGDGSVLVATQTTADTYNLLGQRTAQQSTAENDLSIIAVSPDGSRAVVQKVESGTAALFLYDAAAGKILAPLVSSSSFDEQDARLGRYNTVVDAAFSPDGRLVSAYRIGGYINVSEELAVFDAATGDKLVSLDPMLLLAPNDERPQPIVTAFEFVSDTLLHWTGGFYHVLYDMQTGSVHQIPLREMAVSVKSGIARYGYLSLTAHTGEDGAPYARFTNHMTGYSESLALSGPLLPKKSSLFGSHYMLMAFARPDSSERIGEALLLDMRDASLVPGWETLYTLSEGCTDIAVLEAPGTDVFYLQITNPSAWIETTVLLRVDPVSGISKAEPEGHAFPDTEYAFAGVGGGAELLLARSNGGTIAYLLEDGRYKAYTLDEPFDTFSQSALLGGTQDTPVLAAVHEGALCLYPLAHPGMQLDADVVWEEDEPPLFAANESGSLVAKAQGHAYALFDGDRCAFTGKADTMVQSLSILQDGSRLAVAAADELRIFTRNGALMTTLPAEDGYALRGAVYCTPDLNPPPYGTVFTESPSRILLLDEATSVHHKGEYRLRLLDADTLKPIAVLAERINPYEKSAPDSITLSPDGRQVAAVERVTLGDKYHRAVSIWSTQNGDLLARTTSPADSGGAATLAILENVMAANAFSYVRYARSGMLLAGFGSGVWVFDPEALATVGYTFSASEINGLPDQTPDGDVVYPCEGVHILSTQSELLKASLPVSLVDHTTYYASLRDGGKACLSQDARWLAVCSTDKTQIFDTSTWQLCGTLANQPVQVVHLSKNRAVYDTGDALYTLSLKPIQPTKEASP